MYIKEFDAWNRTKKELNETDHGIRVRVGEIRWISCGVNIGAEMDGKGKSFTRPALILHVVGSSLALIAPLSTKLKQIPGYLQFEFGQRSVSLCIHQVRIISQQRFLSRMGRISKGRLRAVKKELAGFFDF
jgi:mRNA interferase MazF